jgi:hypothetical protein
VTPESRSPLLLGRCSRHLRKSCAGANMAYSRVERVFIFEHYFASKLFAAVREAFSNAYPDKEVANKTTIHWLVTEFRDRWSVCDTSGVGLCWQMRRSATLNTSASAAEIFQNTVSAKWIICAFGHHDLQTLWCQTFFCGDFSKKESIWTVHEAWRNRNTIFHRLLPTLTQKHFAKSHGTH